MEVKRSKNENIIDYTINFKFTCNSSNESLKKVFRGEPSEFLDGLFLDGSSPNLA